MIPDYEHLIIAKDVFLLGSGVVGVCILLFIYIKNLGIRLHPIYTRENDPQELKHFYDHKPSHTQPWEPSLHEEVFFLDSRKEGWVLWNIQTFSAQAIVPDKQFSSVAGEPWFVFSKNQEEAENIIDPIVKKILTKYRKKLNSTTPIEVVSLSTQNSHKLYTWLKTQTHIRSAIFTFLDEIIHICQIARVEPRLRITHTSAIHLEITIPHNKFSNLVHDKMRKSWGLEVFHQNDKTILKLWIAFSPDAIPESITAHYQMQDHYSYSFLHLKKTASNG